MQGFSLAEKGVLCESFPNDATASIVHETVWGLGEEHNRWPHDAAHVPNVMIHGIL